MLENFQSFSFSLSAVNDNAGLPVNPDSWEVALCQLVQKLWVGWYRFSFAEDYPSKEVIADSPLPGVSTVTLLKSSGFVYTIFSHVSFPWCRIAFLLLSLNFVFLLQVSRKLYLNTQCESAFGFSSSRPLCNI